MNLLSENPWPLVWVCLGVSLACLVTLRFTQRGKFLLYAVIAAGLALLLLGVDAVWVTDRERVEEVVRQVADATKRSDADAVLAHLTPDVALEEGAQRGVIARGEPARLMIRAALGSVQLETVNVTDIEAEAGAISRQGGADIRVTLRGTVSGSVFSMVDSDWSFGLEETQPGVWKVNRITSVRLPGNYSFGAALGGRGP